MNSKIFLIFLSLFTFLFLLYKNTNIKSKIDKNTKEISGIIINITKEDNDLIKITLKSDEKIIVYYYGDLELEIGTKIKVEGQLEEFNNNTIFNTFNIKKYMLSKKIYYKMIASNIYILDSNVNWFYRFKAYLIERIEKLKSKAYIYTFILGINTYIDDNVKESYRTNGISHLFSISGMHITLLSSIILYILNKIKKTKYNNILIILFLLFYLLLTGYSSSIIRATLLFIFITINKFLNLKISNIRLLIYIMCLAIIINPYCIYDIGFQFSYIISFFLIRFSNLISNKKHYLSKTFMTSLIAFLSSLPILINNYYYINFITILNNIIFVPIISFIMFPMSILVLFINKLDYLYYILITLLENLSLFMQKINIIIILKKTNIFILLIYYLLIYYILIKMNNKKYYYIFILFIVIFIHYNINVLNNNLSVTYLDVSQGDSIFISFPNNKKNILIDSGGSYYYSYYKNIITYIKSLGIKKIDFLIITHGDSDHMGEAINLVNNFKVENVILNCGEYNELENELINILDKLNIKYYSCINELNIDNYKLQFLNTYIYDNENDNSSVIYLNYNNYKFLFMGDASIEIEKDILNKYNLNNIDFLKVGHHGSNTSSSEYFINTIKPKYSLISVGESNRYGHPKESVIDTLEENGSKIYRTDNNGSIEIKIKRDGYTIGTCMP